MDLKQKIIWLMVVISLLCGLFTGCAKPEVSFSGEVSMSTVPLPEVESAYGISVAVVYDGENDSLRCFGDLRKVPGTGDEIAFRYAQ